LGIEIKTSNDIDVYFNALNASLVVNAFLDAVIFMRWLISWLAWEEMGLYYTHRIYFEGRFHLLCPLILDLLDF
jgi:hypothetical protein